MSALVLGRLESRRPPRQHVSAATAVCRAPASRADGHDERKRSPESSTERIGTLLFSRDAFFWKHEVSLCAFRCRGGRHAARTAGYPRSCKLSRRQNASVHSTQPGGARRRRPPSPRRGVRGSVRAASAPSAPATALSPRGIIPLKRRPFTNGGEPAKTAAPCVVICVERPFLSATQARTAPRELGRVPDALGGRDNRRRGRSVRLAACSVAGDAAGVTSQRLATAARANGSHRLRIAAL